MGLTFGRPIRLNSLSLVGTDILSGDSFSLKTVSGDKGLQFEIMSPFALDEKDVRLPRAKEMRRHGTTAVWQELKGIGTLARLDSSKMCSDTPL